MNLFHRKTLFLHVCRIMEQFLSTCIKNVSVSSFKESKIENQSLILSKYFETFFCQRHVIFHIFFFLPSPPSSSFFFFISSDHSKQVNRVQLVPEFQRYVRAHSNDACAMMMIACHVTGLRLCNSQQRQSHLISSLLAVA